VHLLFQLTTVDGETFEFNTKVYLVDKLVYGILLSNSFLKRNYMDFRFAKHKKDFNCLK